MFFRLALCWMCLAAWTVCAQTAQILKLTDGGAVSGRLVAFKDQHIQVALEGGGETPNYTNVPWARLSQEALQQLMGNRQAAPYAAIFLDPPVRERTANTPRKLTLVQPPRLDRPQSGSLFASPVMLVVLLLVFAANVYAGWEIGIYRQRPAAMVAAVSAFLPIVGPAIFLAMPTRRQKMEELVYEAPPSEDTPIVMEEAPAPVVEQSEQPAVPQPVVYPRGQFTFNRRFFETKFAGFLKMVPGEAERDKVIHIKSARGEYTGQRLSKIEPNELLLQIRKGTATEDVMIPFSEIYEVTVKHKDT
ncbi:MAG TPA: hypothetical protein VK846_07875 [Candidatus Limnocylindria bacterium]|nr:hypothetical protein [Candidatus Limnocylindria bacterium]